VSAQWVIQEAVYAALNNSVTLSALISDVYDDVPATAAFPYVVIGESTAIMWDTKSTLGVESTVTVHTWSRYRGRKETKLIQQAIYDILHNQELSITGYNSVYCFLDFEENFLDEDGLTRHGVSRYRLVTSEV